LGNHERFSSENILNGFKHSLKL